MAIPGALPEKYEGYWIRPWTLRARSSSGFKTWLLGHKYLSPHFTLTEARCKDGTAVPSGLRKAAQRHAFQLERLRHRLGDKPIAITSWYRTPTHNRRVGGASASKHLEALATDHPVAWLQMLGRSFVMTQAEVVFRSGGLGRYSNGSIHTDSRGYRSRWS